MRVHFMLQGTSMPHEVDPEQRLSPVCKDQLARSAKAIHDLGLKFGMILCAPNTAARETAEYVASCCGFPLRAIVPTDALSQFGKPKEIFTRIKEKNTENSLLVGSRKSLMQTAALLLKADTLDIRFEPAGLTRISLGNPLSAGTLDWHLTPAQLSLMTR